MLFYYKLSAANAASKLLRVQNDLAGLLPVNRTAAFGTGNFIVLMVRSCSLFKAFFLFGSSTLYMIPVSYTHLDVYKRQIYPLSTDHS